MLRTILINYEDPSPTTWFYLSFLLALAVFFKFSRFWSLRNLDLVTLLLLTPGALLVLEGKVLGGLIWLLVGSAFLLIRLLIDPLMLRRPLLEPNLNVAGLTFLAAALLAFMMDSVVGREPSAAGLQGARWAQSLLDRREMDPKVLSEMTFGPTSGVLHALTLLPARGVVRSIEPLEPEVPYQPDEVPYQPDYETSSQEAAARMLALIAHLSVVVALVVCCRAHFGSTPTGVAAATLYLLLPYTSYRVELVEHVLPASLLIWAVVACRKPVIAGVLLGLACGFAYFLIFLVPLWIRYFGRARSIRFGIALGTTVVLLFTSVILTSSDLSSAGRQTLALVSWNHWQLNSLERGTGIWSPDAVYQRVPIFVGFLALVTSLVLRRSRGRFLLLLSGTAAVVLTAQFWYCQASGTYISWYLPLLLLTVFRPSRSNWLAAERAEESASQGQQRLRKSLATTV